ncbi:hypothetical protein OIO90_003371 [Microbotryomycetes sp. JL221]|nr:hypothetical protein OIO90_003371 [Microbotryomycetes sp. JL221]
MASSVASTSRWTLDYVSLAPRQSAVQDPPGYVAQPTRAATPSTTSTKNVTAVDPRNLDSLRQQKAWEVALAPAKNVPMQAFMMYMTGGGVQIFSMMSVWFLLKQAVGGAINVNKAFAPFEKTAKASSSASSTAASVNVVRSFTNQKLVFVVCQIGLLMVGLWKLNSMGLLPTHESDWLAFEGSPTIDKMVDVVVL